MSDRIALRGALVQIPVGDGFRYELHGRRFGLSDRCILCKDFGAYAGTRCCDFCETQVLLLVGPIREERESSGQLKPGQPF